MTIDEDAIRRRLMDNFEDYAGRALFIRTKSGGIEPFKLNRPQRYLHEKVEAQLRRTGKVRVIVVKARQWGASTYVAGRNYHKISHRLGVQGFTLAHKGDSTNAIYNMTRRFHEHCPGPIKPSAQTDSAKALSFGQLGSGIEIGTAGSKAVGRGYTIQYLHGSEVAFWENAEQHIEGLLQAVPDLPETEIILESTANGPAGVFYNMAMAALSGHGEFELVFVPWFMHDEYRKQPPKGWVKPEAFREYQRLHDLKNDQIYWAHGKNTEMTLATGGSTDEICPRFRQEYPATVHEAFQSTTEDLLIKPACRKAEVHPHMSEPIILGVDVARGGGDKSRLLSRQGRRYGHLADEVLDSGDLMEVAGWVVHWMMLIKADHVFVDITGLGAGVVDRLTERNFTNVTGINFGRQRGIDRGYANKRAEMWGRLAKHLTSEPTPQVPTGDMVLQHLCATTYRWDSDSRLLLEKKEDIKKRVGFSPDWGDAAALTHAEHVEPKDENGYSWATGDEADTYDEVVL